MARHRLGTRRALHFKRRVSSTPTWPTGADGALVVNATVVALSNGVIKDYSSITLINGGILEILTGSAWTRIGCLGSLTIDTLSGSQILVDGITDAVGGTVTATVPSGEILSHTFLQAGGGAGGSSGIGGGGGDTSAGNGGGGGGSEFGSTATDTVGGDGGNGDNGALGGGGALINIGFGGNGNNDDQSGSPGTNASGAGGGGGSRGINGALLFLKVSGTMNVTLGGAMSAIVFESSVGGGGGSGGEGDAVDDGGGPSASGGGGGGGAAGGCGGTALIRWRGVGTNPSTICDVSNGNGGAAGSGGGGIVTGTGTPLNGSDGAPGDSGAVGSVAVSIY